MKKCFLNYINIVKIIGSVKPNTMSKTGYKEDTDEIQIIVNLYKNHACIKQIKNKIMPESTQKTEKFSFKPATVEIIKKLLNGYRYDPF